MDKILTSFDSENRPASELMDLFIKLSNKIIQDKE
jgi:hypothetical protein